MLVRFLRGLTGYYGHAAPGDVLDLAPHVARDLTRRGLVESVECPPWQPPPASPGLVSLVTPTRNRGKELERLAFMVKAFDWPAELAEWLILPDSPDDVSKAVLSAGHVRVLRPAAIPLGLKRQRLAEESIGLYILHLDDDDYYGPNYVRLAVESLTSAAVTAEAGAPFVDESSDVWIYNRDGDDRYAIGATLAYRRDVISCGLLAFRSHMRVCEDTDFVSAARSAGLFSARAASGQYVGTIHSRNTSRRQLKSRPWSRGSTDDMPRWWRR